MFDNDFLNRYLSQVYCDIDCTLRWTDIPRRSKQNKSWNASSKQLCHAYEATKVLTGRVGMNTF